MPRLLNAVAILALLASGCVHPPTVLCSAMIHNDTSRVLHNFRIVHHPSQRILAGNQLLPDSDFSLGLDHYTLRATSATLSWEDPVLGRRETTLVIPACPEASGPQRLIYDLQSSGRASIRFSPCR